MAYDPRPEVDESSKFDITNEIDAELMKDLDVIKEKHGFSSMILIATTCTEDKSSSKIALIENRREPFFLLECAVSMQEYYLEREIKVYKQRIEKVHGIMAQIEKVFTHPKDN
jgi:hypothetical protein